MCHGSAGQQVCVELHGNVARHAFSRRRHAADEHSDARAGHNAFEAGAMLPHPMVKVAEGIADIQRDGVRTAEGRYKSRAAGCRSG